MMTKVEFIEYMKLYDSFWPKAVDKHAMDAWYGALGNLDGNRFRQCLYNLSRKLKFAPRICEIVEEYQELVELSKPPKDIIPKEVFNKPKCKICNNSGMAIYEKNGYPYTARCDCDYGGYKWSEAQRDPTNKIYVMTLKEALTPDEYAIYYAKLHELYSAPVDQQQVKQALKNMGVNMKTEQ